MRLFAYEKAKIVLVSAVPSLNINPVGINYIAQVFAEMPIVSSNFAPFG
ncbi:hypothetical protein QIS74_13737 [Colletotrichum tabaci]|uniref:Uncharacterized protein n=1 Tax=Colletotrichum tabaci TaxID=1209068 RepID=A0AAV9SSW7_9PEZI